MRRHGFTKPFACLPDNRLTHAVRVNRKLIVVLALLAILSVIGEIVLGGGFISWPQILSTMRFASYTALFALCQMVVVSGGGSSLDLSVGYIATISAIFGVAIMQGQGGWSFVLAVLAAVGVGAAFGAVNGVLIAYFDLSPLVVTMSMSSIIQGIINVYAAGSSISGKPSQILRTLTVKATLGIPNIVLMMVALILLVTLLLRHFRKGQVLLGLGENARAAYLSGANVKRYRLTTFVVSGLVAGLIGLILAGNMDMAFKDMGSSYVMPSYAAVVVGCVSLVGGEASYLRVALGAVFLQTLSNLFIQLGGGDAVKWLGYGLILYVLLLVYAGDQRKK